MTNVIELAKQAGIVKAHAGWFDPDWQGLERFIKLVSNAALEEAAQTVAPKSFRPCDCSNCDCGNRDDAQRVAEWDADNFAAQAIRNLKEPTP